MLASSARAEEPTSGPPPEAKRAFLDGKAAFERGDYALALQLFQRAALIAPAPSLYYNIGIAEERLGRYEDSAIAFERYLEMIDAPQSDEERAFQTQLRARAAANRARAKQAAPDVPPAPLLEPPLAPAPSAAPRYPRYAYPAPLPVAPALTSPPPLTHAQKIDKARRHRNNAIALTVIGGSFLVAGAALTGWGVTYADTWTAARFSIVFSGGSLLLTGVPLAIPGAVSLGKWQKELSAERRRPDDGAAGAKAALEQAAPIRF